MEPNFYVFFLKSNFFFNFEPNILQIYLVKYIKIKFAYNDPKLSGTNWTHVGSYKF